MRSVYIEHFCLAAILLGVIVTIVFLATGILMAYPAGLGAGFWLASLWMHVTDPDALPIAP